MLSLEMRALMANREKWEEDMRNLPICERMILYESLYEDPTIERLRSAYWSGYKKPLRSTCRLALVLLTVGSHAFVETGYIVNGQEYTYSEEYENIPMILTSDVKYSDYARTIAPIILRQIEEIENKIDTVSPCFP